MQTKNNGGDVLARGGVRARFGPPEGVTQDKWNSIFDDFDPEAYRNGTSKSGSDAVVPASGDAGVKLGETDSSEPITR